ncbi:MAG: bifunctional D-glycero-beta-D-manno-heptose-7-phosphate kinase/D-glycero-beta-D-manno-heptose 1-phosphate adenylyltransferase HldE [Desulfobacterales bacterium]
MSNPLNIDALSQATVLVIGDVMLDRYLWGAVQRISPEAPVPVVRVSDRSEVLGGAGNVAANLSGLGCHVTLIGTCGSDETGKRVMTLMTEKGIGNSLLVEDAFSTTAKTRIIAQKQQLIRLDEEETRLLDTEVQSKLLTRIEMTMSQSDAVILSDYGKGIFQTAGITEEIISLCRKSNIPVLVDPKGGEWERYRGATCVTPNISELARIVGYPQETDEEDAWLVSSAQTIRDRFQFENLLVTRGDKGMCLVGSEGTPLMISAKAREVYDVSGAGDTVIATLGATIAGGYTFPEAAVIANEAAGIVVTKLGTQPIRREELDAVIRMNGVDSKHCRSRKIAGIDAARLQVQAWRAAGEKIVFTNGCFDLLHPGHISLLHQAKDMGDRLIVGLNSDASISRLKGPDRPILSEDDRSELLAALSSVDSVVIFTEDTPLDIIEILKPDILVKGSDYQAKTIVGRDLVESYGGKVQIVELIEGVSTTGIVDKISKPPRPAISE